jgi:RimJ/RimL family protein N-acetyltransferase
MSEQQFTPTHIYTQARQQNSSKGLGFLEIEPQHLEIIRTWRNQQLEVLRQKVKITEEEQASYCQTGAWPEMIRVYPKQMIYMLEAEGEPVGYGGLVHIDWDHLRAEISFLLAPALERDETSKARFFSLFLSQISDVAFRSLGLNRVYAETYSTRSDHIKILEKCNFVHEGTKRGHVMIGDCFVDSVFHGRLSGD